MPRCSSGSASIAQRRDLTGLRAVYAAWCEAVSFDNVLKLIHIGEGRPGPLPGWTADDFFESWLACGAGGTCWAGNGALHDLLAALGFEVERAVATMLSSPEARGPESRLGGRHSRRRALDRRRLDPQRRADPDPGAGRAGAEQARCRGSSGSTAAPL